MYRPLFICVCMYHYHLSMYFDVLYAMLFVTLLSGSAEDLVILDLGMRIEQIAAEHPDAHVILSADVCIRTSHSEL